MTGDWTPTIIPRRQVFLLLLGVALIWTLELFGVQALSFSFDYPVPLHKWMGAQTIRLTLDIFFAAGCVFLLPRGCLILLFIGFTILAQITGYYEAVFGRALTLTTMQAQWVEGVVGARFDWSYVNKPLLVVLLATLAIKIWLLLCVERQKALRRTLCWTGTVAWAGYVLFAASAMAWVDPPQKLRTFVTGDRLGMTYGFVLLWASEAIYLNQEHLLREAVAQRGSSTDRLSAIEPPLALAGDVALLQVESLDWRVLQHCVNGKPVTPFLNRLTEEAMVFKITAAHVNGSGDADFVMLNAVPPSPSVMTYSLVRYPYHDTLPQIAERAGYATAAFHGNSGQFFSRERAFKRMGFDELWFQEELQGEGRLPVSLWGVRDDKVLAFSQQRLQAPHGAKRWLHYIITLTSHQPFSYLEPEECTFLPGAESMADRYFNNMAFVDRCLAAYVAGLAQGTLVVIFGDHRAMVEYGETHVRDSRLEYVPFIIHRVGERLAAQQASRASSVACSGELTMLDAASYLQRIFQTDDSKKQGGL